MKGVLVKRFCATHIFQVNCFTAYISLIINSKCSQYKVKRQNWIRGVEVAKDNAIIPV